MERRLTLFIGGIWGFVFLIYPIVAAVSYSYDTAGRLIRADYGAAGAMVYTYDVADHTVSRRLEASRDLNAMAASMSPTHQRSSGRGAIEP